jgi:hypothetical protein
MAGKFQFRLFNGAKTREAWNPKSAEFVDDWKPESLTLECEAVQVTYGSHIHVHSDDGFTEFFWTDDGFIEHDGVFYGDFIVDAGVEHGDD